MRGPIEGGYGLNPSKCSENVATTWVMRTVNAAKYVCGRRRYVGPLAGLGSEERGEKKGGKWKRRGKEERRGERSDHPSKNAGYDHISVRREFSANGR